MAESSIGRDWIMVRIQRETHRALRELADAWDRLYSQGRTDVPHDADKALSIDRIISELLRRDDDHRARSRSNSPNRAASGGKPKRTGQDGSQAQPSDRSDG